MKKFILRTLISIIIYSILTFLSIVILYFFGVKFSASNFLAGVFTGVWTLTIFNISSEIKYY